MHIAAHAFSMGDIWNLKILKKHEKPWKSSKISTIIQNLDISKNLEHHLKSLKSWNSQFFRFQTFQISDFARQDVHFG